MSESKITIADSCTVFEGPDAILLVKAVSLKSALKLALHGIKITRGVGPKRLLEVASTITHKEYGRQGKLAMKVAIDDLEQWIVAMKAALPIVNQKTEN